ncbi:MAG: DUF4157 domain-containing protein [Candidatus Thorarchaeota archaeon]
MSSPTETSDGFSPIVAEIQNASNTGSPLSENHRSFYEDRFQHDFSRVSIHSGIKANNLASDLHARAFTLGNDIFLGRHGTSLSKDASRHLLAHELAHVIQQESLSRSSLIQKQAIESAPAPIVEPEAGTETEEEAIGEEPPTEVINIQGESKLPLSPKIKQWLEKQDSQQGMINVRFGNIATGRINIRKQGNLYCFNKQALTLNHPLLARLKAITSELTPQLLLTAPEGEIRGFIGLGAQSRESLDETLKKMPEVIGLSGIDLSRIPKLTNILEKGHLNLGVSGQVMLGGAFSTELNLNAQDENITFSAFADIKVRGLASAKMELKREADGKITGEGTADVQVSKSVTGTFNVVWDGSALSGSGTVGYEGEKFSGQVMLALMEREEARQKVAEKKAEAEGKEPPAAKKKPGKKKTNYVLFGEGDLNFSFTDWLSGTAHVIVDQKGDITVMGEIKPQKEFEIFPQKDYVKELLKVEGRAKYGLPVVGNIFIFIGVGLDAFAKLGPAKFYDIVVKGTYSTDPKVSKDFSVEGRLNISAAAGLRVRGEAGLGVEILAHDIKAGAGVNGIAAIRGYAEAMTKIGYREKGKEGEDKRGEFFIKGNLEIAAQPFLGLSGDLFVEVDAPWWSPVPDKKWTWPLGGKEWPIGGSYGLNAGLDYVIGSGEPPTIDLQPAEFSAEKFMTDLYSDKAKDKSPEKETKGTWKEKGTKEADVPPKKPKQGNATHGKIKEAQKAKSKVKPGISKKSKKEVGPKTKTAEGKTVEDLQKEAAKKGKKPKAAQVPSGELEPDKVTPEAQKGSKWERGKEVVKQALAFADKTGIGEKDLKRILNSIRKQKRYGFTALYPKRIGKKWEIIGSMSKGSKIGEVKATESTGEEKPYTWAEIRRRTPTEKLREWAQEELKKIPGYPVDPAFPKEENVQIDGPGQADHIVAANRIRKSTEFTESFVHKGEKMGFWNLNNKNKLAVMNLKENFEPMSPLANRSRGDKKFAEWWGYKKKNIPADANFKKRMIAKERESEGTLKKKIRMLLKEQLAQEES